MKPYCLCIALLILVLNSFAEIRNGYAPAINSARASLEVYNSLLLKDQLFTAQKRRAMEAKLEELVSYITYFELTERLLKQLKATSPEIYHEINTLRDSNGQITNVYVKFIDGEEAAVKAWGVTGIAQSPNDANTCLSEYGEHSVSIKVWAVSQALLVLSHEFGHVKYIVPNLAAYKNYYTKNYPACSTESNHVGHNADDPSGRSALIFERRFKAGYYARYWKKEIVQKDSPPVLVNKIRRAVLSRMVAMYSAPV